MAASSSESRARDLTYDGTYFYAITAAGPAIHGTIKNYSSEFSIVPNPVTKVVTIKANNDFNTIIIINQTFIFYEKIHFFICYLIISKFLFCECAKLQ